MVSYKKGISDHNPKYLWYFKKRKKENDCVFIVALFDVLGAGGLRAMLAARLSKYIQGSEGILKEFFGAIGSGLILSGLLIQISLTFNYIKFIIVIISSIFLFFTVIKVLKHNC